MAMSYMGTGSSSQAGGSQKATANARPRARPESVASSNKKEDQSFGSKVMGGLRSIGNDLAMGTRFKEPDQDYKKRTAKTLEAMRDPTSVHYKGNLNKRDDNGSNILAEEEIETPVVTPEQIAENKKRYDDYMAEQEANARKAAQMPRALSFSEQMNRGAGPVPLQMQGLGAFSNPYMQQATSPAFNYAAQNYGQLGGQQRMYDRPMEMMSRRERQGVNQMAERMAQGPMPMPMQPQSNPYLQGLMAGSKGAGQTQPQVQSDFGRMLAAKYGNIGNMMNKGNQGGGFGF